MQPTAVRVDVHDTIFHALWNELHSDVRTAEQFADWVKRVPSFGCSCSSWLKDYLAKNPPHGDLRRYGFFLHRAVSEKLGKPEFTWAEFETKYGSHTDGNQDSG